MDTSLHVAFGSAIAAAASRHHLDPRLLAAVAAQETGGPGRDGGRNVVGDGGHGHGLFQIDDRWHPFARSRAAMDPASNADYAAGLIASNLRRYGNVRAALSAYNAGSPDATGTRTDWGDGKPVGYADSVLRHFLRLAGGAPASPTLAAHAGSVNDTRTSTKGQDMGFNLLSAAAGAAQGALFGGNPLAIGAGALAGGFGGSGASTVGGFGNSAQNLLNGGYLGATEALNAQQMLFQLQLQGQSQQFDEMTSERSELLRQQNTLRDVAMQQRKADNEITKEFIRTIG